MFNEITREILIDVNIIVWIIVFVIRVKRILKTKMKLQ